MGKSKKKKGKSGGSAGETAEKKLGRRKQMQKEQRQREENEKKAEKAIAAGLKKLAEQGITNDTDLFAPIPTSEDCPICMVPHPAADASTLMTCCGKLLCTTCIEANEKTLMHVNVGREIKKQPPLPISCAFCRAGPWKTEQEYLDQMMKLVKSDRVVATYILARHYEEGKIVEQDKQKAFDLTIRAVELGNASAFNDLAIEYAAGEILQMDMQKNRICSEASARAGSVMAHRNLGDKESNRGNYALAIKHYHVAAGAGHKLSLDRVQELRKEKKASADDFLRAIRVYQKAIDEQSSDERKKWAEKEKKKEQSKAM